MRKKICFLFCALLFCTAVSSQTLRIRVFSQQQIKEAVFIPSFGHYSMEVSDKKVKLSKTTKVSVREQSAKVEVRIGDTLFASGEKVRFCAEGLKSFFCIKPLNPAVAERRYDDGLEISSDKKGNLLFINTVEQENYIAGVVQSETWGATKNIDFFKVQAVCCRNYLLRNIGKHSKDGYNLCDDVHCQAYKTRANHPEVTEGAYNSRGEVIVDQNGKLIETLFHSNSGGQTANASDVWGKEIPYLVSVIDSFSVGGKNYTWEKFIKQKTWIAYFKNKGINVKDEAVKQELLHFSQKEGRKKELLGVPLTTIRKDFGLKSTYFDIQEWGSEVKLSGKGYGHAVGLSQEGAIKMCEDGYEYWQVIEHYFKGAKVIKQQTNPEIK